VIVSCIASDSECITMVGVLPQEAVLAWMREKCPSRSGDKKEIFWMVHDAADFYFDVYRSATAQLKILNFALDQDPTLRDRLSDTDGKNQWDRNCAVLLGQNSYLREWHR
jgi:hypothetical protein